MLFRQLFDQDSSTYTYLLADAGSREAVIIDPVVEQFERDRTLIEELELTLRFILETHVHADHVTGGSLLRERFGAQSIISERAGVVCADRLVKHGDVIQFGAHTLRVRETPGHTDGCVTYVCAEPPLAFTGDALLIRGCGRTDFQHGDSARLYRSVHEQIFSLSDDTVLYPAHDYRGRTSTSVREEKRWNPRLGASKSERDFIEIMSRLDLPYPRKIDLAVPSNLQCGGSQLTAAAADLDTSWAPIQLSSAGVPELAPEWLRDHPSEPFVIDVREPDEYRGELGHIAGAASIPLATLQTAAHHLPRDRALVLVCRSGGRSGRAAVDLAKWGFSRAASLRGGMVEWNARKLPVDYGAPRTEPPGRQG